MLGNKNNNMYFLLQSVKWCFTGIIVFNNGNNNELQ